MSKRGGEDNSLGNEVSNSLSDKGLNAKMAGKSWSQVLKSDPPAEVHFEYFPLAPGSEVVNPPDEVLIKGNDKFRFSIVGTFTKKAASFNMVCKFARRLWGNKGLEKVFQKDVNVLF